MALYEADRATYSKTTYDILFRLVLIGDSGVGKTALLLRYTDDTFDPSFMATIGIDFKIKTIDIEGKRVKLQVWDTAGQEQFHSVSWAYYRNAHGVMLLYDLTDVRSFLHISEWVEDIRAHAPSNIKQILIGNKCDITEAQRVIDKEKGAALAQELGIPFLETSAKMCINVEMAFEMITMDMMRSTAATEERRQLDLVNLNQPKPSSSHREHKKCCNKSTS